MKRKLLKSTMLLLCVCNLTFAQSPTNENNDNPTVFQPGNGMDQYLVGARKAGFDMPNMSETACGSGEKRKIHDVLSDMKPLIINWEGYNCGNCRAHAKKVGEGMAQNKDKVNFWFAFGALGNDGTCSKTGGNSIGKWIADFPGYELAFGFLDNDKTYCLGDYNLPQFIVIDPRTKKVVINTTQNRDGGEAFPKALAEALKISNAITGIDNLGNTAASFSLYPNPFVNELEVVTNNPEAGSVALFDLSGRQVFAAKINPGETNVLALNQLNSGFYVAKLLNANGDVLMVNKVNKK